MEEWHSKTISKKFAEHLGSKRIICLNIPDEFERMDPTLVSILKSKVPPFSTECSPLYPEDGARSS